MASDSICSSASHEQRWAEQIRKKFQEEVAVDINCPSSVSIFNVPKAITARNPEAYIPQVIALGPYHHFQPELYPMERYKVAAVKSLLNPNQILNFQTLVIDKLKELDSTVRACYHKYIDFDEDTLAWIMAVDGLFLLDLLRDYADSANGKKLTREGILCRDFMVLENQIPFIILKEIRKMLNLSASATDCNDSELVSMVQRLCVEHSPLKFAGGMKNTRKACHPHLLDVMYHLIVNHNKTTKFAPSDQKSASPNASTDKEVNLERGQLLQNLEEIEDVAADLGIEGEILQPVQVIGNLPWQKISNILGLKASDSNNSPGDEEEIVIPSVSYLYNIGGIKFSPTDGGIKGIRFVVKEVTFYLPVLALNSNSEVFLRNLVAYEAATSDSGLELAQYVGLMCGIIDTAEDAKLLKEKGIIKGNLSSEEIANMFTGMNDIAGKEGNKTIEEINTYFNKRPKVKAYRMIRKRIYASWKFLTLVTTVLLISLTILQSFCEVYSCPPFFGRSS